MTIPVENARRGRPRKNPGEDDDIKRGVNALDHALTVLKLLAELKAPATLTDIARAASMPATKVHRYLASFIAAGLVSQSERSGRYDLGKTAMEIGLSAIARNDIVNQVADRLIDLTEATGCTAMLSIWGNQGPTVVRWERAATFIVTTLGLGTTFPLLNSATGRIFLTNLPDRLTSDALDREILARKTAGGRIIDMDVSKRGLARLKDQILGQGYATVEGRLIPGLQAASAPVLNWQNEVECAVTLISTTQDIFDPEQGALPELLKFVRQFSIKLAAVQSSA
jgi:DNA-binding IclR family transcriptional regulator